MVAGPVLSRDGDNLDECRRRQDALWQAATHAGCRAVLVWGRGGGYADRHGDLWYFSNYYPGFPTIPDEPGVWRDRGFAALLLCSDGAVLVADAPAPDGEVAADRVVASSDLVATLAEELGTQPTDGRPIGLVGADCLTAGQRDRFAAARPGSIFADLQGVVGMMRRRKSALEIALLRESALVGARALTLALRAVRPGRTSAAVVSAAAAHVFEHAGTVLNAFVDTYPLPPNAMPGRRRLPSYSAVPLREGDTFTLDLSGVVGSYYFDLARSVIVGGDDAARSSEQRRVIQLSRDVVDACVASLQPGRRIAEAARAGLRLLEAAGARPTPGGFLAFGHGIGLGFESPWLTPEDEEIVEPGMCLCVEKRIVLDGHGATHERMVLVGDDGPVDLALPEEVGAPG